MTHKSATAAQSADVASWYSAAASRVRHIELTTRGLVESLFSGEYHSVFKGRGLEFADLREYQPGDDVRSIDWNVTARRGTPFVREYVEERQLSALLIVDMSASHRVGSGGTDNRYLASEIAAILALCAVANNDRVGLLLVTDKVEAFVPEGAGRRHALRLVFEMVSFTPAHRGTRLSAALDFAARVLRRRSIVFVISDFLTGERTDPELRAAALRCRFDHDLVPIRLIDPRAEELPNVGLLAVLDPELGARRILNTASAKVRSRYARAVSQQKTDMSALFRDLRLDALDVNVPGDHVARLVEYFRRRERSSR